MFLAAGGLPPVSIMLPTLAGGAFVAAASNIFNSYLDRDIDARMERTRNRPLPAGRLNPLTALVSGVISGSTGLLILGMFVNWQTTALALFALVYYVVPYTLWLKRNTPWTAIICSGIGAIPPLIGWASVTGSIQFIPLLLAAIIIFWTVPHFWSLALTRRDDYRRAGINVLPAEGVSTFILVSLILLLAASLLLGVSAGLSPFYLSIAGLTGIINLGFVKGIDGPERLKKASRLYRFSVIYIIVIFGGIIADVVIF
jgi:heme o synthase